MPVVRAEAAQEANELGVQRAQAIHQQHGLERAEQGGGGSHRRNVVPYARGAKAALIPLPAGLIFRGLSRVKSFEIQQVLA